MTTDALAQADKRIFAFGHSLIDHRPPLIPTPSDETTILHWIHDLAAEESQSVYGGGQYGFLPQHANLPPISQWGYDSVPGVWESDYEPFSAADINTILITAGNFIQWQAPDEEYITDPGVTPVSATEDVFDWVDGEEPNCRFYIYENWPDMAPYLDNGFPPSEQELDDYWLDTNADFHDWWIDYHDLLLASRPALEVKMIPVGPILSGIFTTVIPDLIAASDIYEDDAPHGRATLYFLAGLTTYMAIYETQAPTSYTVPSTVDIEIANNYQLIVDYIWDELVAFNTDDGDSRVFYSQVSADVTLKSESITLYPNPVNGEFTLEGLTSSYTIEILDNTGAIYETLDNTISPVTVDVSNLPEGTYLIRVTLNDNSTVELEKILKIE